jgi:Tol biopolymer transport system component
MKRILITAVVIAASFVGMPTSHATSIDGFLVLDDGSTGQIYRLSQNGSDLTQLTHVPSGQQAFSPRWSPDGQHIVFGIFANNHDRLYTMAWDGTGKHRLRTDTPAWNNDAPSYFPSGKRIVFARCHVDGNGCELATVRTDGTHFRTLTHTGHEVFDFAPDVSPDGRRIAFAKFNANGIHSQVWVMKSDGTGAHPVTRPALEASSPRWSPDGSKLIVSSNCCRLGGNVYRIPATGGRPTQLTHTPWPAFSGGIPSYAPSSSKIAFISDRGHPDLCCFALFVMRADGTHQAKLPIGLTGVVSVDWSRAIAS